MKFKKFSQMDLSNLWNDFELTNVPGASSDGLKTALIENLDPLLKDWYSERYLCLDYENKDETYTDNLWKRFLYRDIKLYAYEYWEMCALLQKDIDPTIVSKVISTVSVTTTGSSDTTTSNTATDKHTGSDTNKHTGTDTITATGTDTHTGTDTTDTTNNGTTGTTNTGNSTQNNKSIVSAYPQSNVSAGTTGMPDTMTWTYASSGTDTKNTDTNNTTSETTTSDTANSETTYNTETGHTANTETEYNNTNTTEYNNTHNITENGSSNTDTTGKSDTKSETSGTGNTPDLYTKFYDFVIKYNPNRYILSKLENLFLSCYSIDESEVLYDD